MCIFKAVLLGMKSTLVSDVQAVIHFKMIAIQNTDLPSGSNSLVKYYVAKLDRSKSQGEYCVENDECQSSVCSLKMCQFSVDSAILDSILYTKLLDLIGEALSRLFYFFNINKFYLFFKRLFTINAAVVTMARKSGWIFCIDISCTV